MKKRILQKNYGYLVNLIGAKRTRKVVKSLDICKFCKLRHNGFYICRKKYEKHL